MLHAVGMACVVVLVSAPAAWAHAELLETLPANQQTVASLPSAVRLTFNEPVTTAFGGIKVYGPDGQRVDSGRVRSRGASVEIRPTSGGAGTYAVAWRVVSADSHPVRGAFTFNVREASRSNVALAKAQNATKQQRPVEIAFGLARALMMGGVLLLVGGCIYRVLCNPSWHVRGIRTWGSLAAIGIVATFVLDAAVAGGFSVAEALSLDVLAEQGGTGYGRASIVRLVALLVAVVGYRYVDGRSLCATRHGRAVVLVTSLPLAWSMSLAGHALSSSHPWIAVPLDMVHVTAASAWLGGLVQLMYATRVSGAADGIPSDAVERFSRIAFLSVVVLVTSGAYASIQRVGFAQDAWIHTTYGRLLACKLLLFAATIPLAARNRLRLVPQLRAGGGGATAAMRVLRRYIRVEGALIVLVVALTAWLVAVQPAREAVAPKLVDVTRPISGGGSLQMVVQPARVGPNTIHVYALTSSGQPDAGITSITATADYARRDFAGLNIGLRAAGPGHATSKAVLPFAGAWSVTVRLERGKFSEERVRIPMRIAAAGSR